VVEVEQKLLTEDPTPPSRWNANVPRDVETTCLKCLHKSPARRYASAQDLADDLHRFLDGKPVLARPVSTVERSWKFARRRPTLTTLLAVVLLGVLTASGGGAWILRQRAERRAEAERYDQDLRNGVGTALSGAASRRRQYHFKEARELVEF